MRQYCETGLLRRGSALLAMTTFSLTLHQPCDGHMFRRLLLMVCFMFSCNTTHSGSYEGPPSDHFDGETFFNSEPMPKHSLLSFLWMRVRTDYADWQEFIPSLLHTKPPSKIERGIRYTVVNHATVLIQTPQLNVLTDPIWSERCSPFQSIGPKRVRAPGIDFADLPPIDVVLMSHNHYDSMDIPTLEKLQNAFHPLILVGLGNKNFLRKMGIENVTELDWWQSLAIKETTFHFVPAKHFSGRGFFDRNRTLWGSFVIENASSKIYFAGDSGYTNEFKLVRQRFPALDLAFLPIGAYRPREFMGPVHMNPDEAVKAHVDLGAKQSVGVHFGTFQLAAEGIDEPALDLRAALQKQEIPEEKFLVPEFGVGYCEGC